VFTARYGLNIYVYCNFILVFEKLIRHQAVMKITWDSHFESQNFNPVSTKKKNAGLLPTSYATEQTKSVSKDCTNHLY